MTGTTVITATATATGTTKLLVLLHMIRLNVTNSSPSRGDQMAKELRYSYAQADVFIFRTARWHDKHGIYTFSCGNATNPINLIKQAHMF